MPNKRKSIPFSLKFKICANPCSVCGVPYDIHCDHILPVAKGGLNNEENLQPLCGTCNMAKKDRMSNPELRVWVLKRGRQHFLRAVFMEDCRFINDYDGPSQQQWAAARPNRVAYANELYEAFLA